MIASLKAGEVPTEGSLVFASTTTTTTTNNNNNTTNTTLRVAASWGQSGR